MLWGCPYFEKNPPTIVHNTGSLLWTLAVVLLWLQSCKYSFGALGSCWMMAGAQPAIGQHPKLMMNQKSMLVEIQEKSAAKRTAKQKSATHWVLWALKVSAGKLLDNKTHMHTQYLPAALPKRKQVLLLTNVCPKLVLSQWKGWFQLLLNTRYQPFKIMHGLKGPRGLERDAIKLITCQNVTRCHKKPYQKVQWTHVSFGCPKNLCGLVMDSPFSHQVQPSQAFSAESRCTIRITCHFATKQETTEPGIS